MLEIDGNWHKSARSGAAGHCVEVACNAAAGGKVFVRNSKDRSGPVVGFTPEEWTAFVAGVRDGEFDLP